MRAFLITVVVTLARFAAVSFATPVGTRSTAPLAPRSHFCQNAPTVVAGTSFDCRSAVAHDLDLVHRTDRVTVWCAPGSRTYITVALTAGRVSARTATSILAVALRRIANQLATNGDSLIPLGVFIQDNQDGRSELYLVNTNNHQQSWGVVGAALMALQGFLQSLNIIAEDFTGGVAFTVFDGVDEVGQGTIE